ncbi:MAG: lipocalin-like domain-containing protein [Chloroflexi bacterium]|nr:lipocalin-like domain-containing protein [Chloroflexota bacterium]
MAVAVAGFLSCAGRYEVDEATNCVIHCIEIHLAPNAVGTRLKRRFEVTKHILTFFTAADAANGRPEGHG